MRGTRVSVEEAAPVLGVTPNKLRYMMRNKKMPDIGEAIKRSGRNGRPRYEYHLYAPKILARVGLEKWPGGE